MRHLAIFLIALLLAACSGSSRSLEASEAWIPLAPPGARVMGGFVSLHNPETADWQLVGVEAEDFGSAEIHSMDMQDGMMRMRQLDALPIPAGGSASLQRGGNHLMLFEPRREFAEGDSTRLSLQLRNAKNETRTLQVTFRISAEAPGHAR